MMTLNSGAAALELRLQMIRSAKKTIEVEYFCYNTDLLAKLLTIELINAAKRGVKVRMLIDKAANVFVFDENYARVLAGHGIELRYFNAASIINITTAIYRNHRKLLVIDEKEAVTGGRNIGDEYFEMAPKLNYNDRDIYVEGPIVKAMRDSFYKFYEHEMSQRPDFSEVSKAEVPEAVKKFYQITDTENFKKIALEKTGQNELAKLKLHTCPVTTFASDAPGGGFWGLFSQEYADQYRFLRKVLIEKISHIDKSVLISTPYFLTSNDTQSMFRTLLKNKVAVSVYTNSLAASDATYMSTQMYFYLRSWVNRGVRFHLHDGTWAGESELALPEVKNGLWSDHSKTHVYRSKNHSEVMIGTFNMHNRSSYYDSEMALFCKGNEELSAEVELSIAQRMRKSITINRDLKGYDSSGKPTNKYGPVKYSVQWMKFMTIPAWILQFLL